MDGSDTIQLNALAESLMGYRERLLALARRQIHPLVARRVTPEEIVQDTLAAACQKADYLHRHAEVPIYVKLRTLLFQTLAAAERTHLQCQKRDAYKEVTLPFRSADEAELTTPWERFVDTATGPLTRATRQDRYEALKRALGDLPENDRAILELRHFDNLTNTECAELLQITPKNASIRYVRALERLQRILTELTEFRP